MTTFLLIRHGTTEAVGRYLAGRRPGSHLTAAGAEEVRRLADRLRSVPLDAVVSSPLERALETAAPIAASHGLTVVTCAALTEFDVGEWTGATFSELAGVDAWQRFNRVRSVSRPPRGELMIDVQRRAVDALLGLRDAYPRGRVVVVSHGDVIRAVLQYALGMPIDFLHRIEISPARVSVLTLGDGEPVVRQVNADTVDALE